MSSSKYSSGSGNPDYSHYRNNGNRSSWFGAHPNLTCCGATLLGFSAFGGIVTGGAAGGAGGAVGTTAALGAGIWALGVGDKLLTESRHAADQDTTLRHVLTRDISEGCLTTKKGTQLCWEGLTHCCACSPCCRPSERSGSYSYSGEFDPEMLTDHVDALAIMLEQQEYQQIRRKNIKRDYAEDKKGYCLSAREFCAHTTVWNWASCGWNAIVSKASCCIHPREERVQEHVDAITALHHANPRTYHREMQALTNGGTPVDKVLREQLDAKIRRNAVKNLAYAFTGNVDPDMERSRRGAASMTGSERGTTSGYSTASSGSAVSTTTSGGDSSSTSKGTLRKRNQALIQKLEAVRKAATASSGSEQQEMAYSHSIGF